MKIKNDLEHEIKYKIQDNFSIMKTNFLRLEKNIKIIISDTEKEIKNLFNEFINIQDNNYTYLVEYLLFIFFMTSLFLLFLTYRFLNIILESQYVKISKDIGITEKN